MSAETWLGAAGWASGSHTCNGTSPALEPVPIIASTNTIAIVNGGKREARIAAKATPPAGPANKPKASSKVRPLKTAMMR